MGGFLLTYVNIGYSVVGSIFQVPHLLKYIFNKTQRLKQTEF